MFCIICSALKDIDKQQFKFSQFIDGKMFCIQHFLDANTRFFVRKLILYKKIFFEASKLNTVIGNTF